MARFRPGQRLRKPAEFDRVFRRGVRLDGALFTLVVAPNERECDRLGLAVSRRVGGAVARNRARRLLRESFRALARAAGPKADLVVIGKPALVGTPFAEVARELAARVRRFEQLAARSRPRAAPAR